MIERVPRAAARRVPFRPLLRAAPVLFACAFLGLGPAALARSHEEEFAEGRGSAILETEPWVATIVLEGRASRVMEPLRELTQEIGPRLTGSPALARAEVWALDRFRAMGLDAHLEKWGEIAVGFHRGPAHGRVLAPEERELEFVTPAWSPGTDGPVRGPAVLAPRTLEELASLGEQTEGAWLVERPRRRRGGVPAEVRKALAERRWLGRISPGRGELLHVGGNHRVRWDSLPTEVRITLLEEQHAELVGWLEESRDVELEFDIRNHFLEGPMPQHNVVADLVGSEWPDEYVIVQAHLDSWDAAEGACDDGTGVATTLEAARILTSAGLVPRRTIRFVLYGGEEQGLLGSSAYVRDHADELARISIVLNHDNGTNPVAGIQATEAMLADFERVFAPARSLDPENPFEIRRVDGLRPGPSDHAPFVQANVPAFHWIQSPQGYSRIHHTQHDVFEAADPASQEHSAIVIALAAYGFAQLDHLVERTNLRAPEPRRMGVFLDGLRIRRVIEGSRAERAGWQEDDVIVAIDGKTLESARDLQRLLQEGPSRKRIRLRRGEEEFETELDWSDDPEEARRLERHP